MGRIHDDATRKEVAYNEILTYLFGEIARHESFGDYSAAHRTIRSLEKAMIYLRDKQYFEDLRKISKIKKKKGTTVAEQKRYEIEYLQEVMDAKHEALVKLAFRSGKLGNKAMSKATPIEEDYEQALA